MTIHVIARMGKNPLKIGMCENLRKLSNASVSTIQPILQQNLWILTATKPVDTLCSP
jgi:hypothetical protein